MTQKRPRVNSTAYNRSTPSTPRQTAKVKQKHARKEKTPLPRRYVLDIGKAISLQMLAAQYGFASNAAGANDGAL